MVHPKIRSTAYVLGEWPKRSWKKAVDSVFSELCVYHKNVNVACLLSALTHFLSLNICQYYEWRLHGQPLSIIWSVKQVIGPCFLSIWHALCTFSAIRTLGKCFTMMWDVCIAAMMGHAYLSHVYIPEWSMFTTIFPHMDQHASFLTPTTSVHMCNIPVCKEVFITVTPSINNGTYYRDTFQ